MAINSKNNGRILNRLVVYLAFILAVLIVGNAVLGGAGSALLPTPNFFEVPSVWEQPIPQNPQLRQNSAEYVAHMKTEAPIFGISYREWSVPVFYAKPDTPVTEVDVKYPNQDWYKVPIPPEAVPAGNAATLSGKYRDGHMVVISADRRWAWDFYQGRKNVDGTWWAKFIRRWDLSTDGINQPYDRQGSCRVSPVPLLRGLITLEEVKSGRISHALALATATAKRYSPGVYPLVGPNSGLSDAPYALQLGFRVQLDPTVDVDSLSLTPVGKIIARAMQEYGMIFVENNGPGETAVYAESLEDKIESWSNVGSLGGIPMAKLRVVDSSLVSAPSPPSAPSGLRIIAQLFGLESLARIHPLAG